MTNGGGTVYNTVRCSKTRCVVLLEFDYCNIILLYCAYLPRETVLKLNSNYT